MDRHAYLTAGLHTEIYDAFHDPDEPSLAGDLAFYLDMAEEAGGSVLDLGCGTGRVSIPLARAGFEVVGLDLSPFMLGIARKKLDEEAPSVSARCRFIEGNMAAFDIPDRFELVIIPFRSFQMLLSAEDQRSCLESVRRHLVPGGRLVVDLFDPDLAFLSIEAWGGAELDWEGDHPLTGNLVRSEVVLRTNDRVHQVFLNRLRFTEFDDSGGELRREEEDLRLRWTYRYEMRYLLELAGFEIEEEYSDFFRSAPAYGGELLFVARAK